MLLGAKESQIESVSLGEEGAALRRPHRELLRREPSRRHALHGRVQESPRHETPSAAAAALVRSRPPRPTPNSFGVTPRRATRSSSPASSGPDRDHQPRPASSSPCRTNRCAPSWRLRGQIELLTNEVETPAAPEFLRRPRRPPAPVVRTGVAGARSAAPPRGWALAALARRPPGTHLPCASPGIREHRIGRLPGRARAAQER